MLRIQVGRGALRQFTTALTKLINCNSCGVKLQDKIPTSVGFYTKPKLPVVSKLRSLEDIKYLLFSQDIQTAKETAPAASLEEVKGSLVALVVCKRCSDAIHMNKYKIEEFPRFLFDDVLKFVPKKSNLVHLVPLPEFPFHFTQSILKDDSFTASLLLTKADQLVKDKATLQKKVLIFFKDFMKYHLGIETNKAIATSASKKWNIRVAYSTLNAENYLIGNANVGKSTLINSMLQEYLGYKIKTDRLGKVITSEPSEKELENPKQFARLQSAGTSHIPNLTRNIQGYKIGDKLVYDLPGFTTDMNEVHLEDIISGDWLDRIRKTDLFKGKTLKKKTYASIKGTDKGGCYSIGGIFFLVPPPGTINQVVKYIPGEGHEFKNVERALEILKSCGDHNEQSHPLAKYCGVNPKICSMDCYARHIIPPFQGSIEIVLKDIGYMLLRTTGTYKFAAPHEIWVPKGIEVCVREPLELLIENGYKEKVESHGKLSACPKKRPIVSSTYVMDANEANPLERMRAMYLERTENDLSSRRFASVDPLSVVTKLHDEPPNLYWYYKW